MPKYVKTEVTTSYGRAKYTKYTQVDDSFNLRDRGHMEELGDIEWDARAEFCEVFSDVVDEDEVPENER
ncbi:hypothetical protein ABZY93_22345 [Streptomyces smyrnaeus]|uniref:hypothetical protein n=1 Tax=Streptomyces smyrnaeus TaxID=1387713 RepID=UPI0033B067AA